MIAIPKSRKLKKTEKTAIPEATTHEPTPTPIPTPTLEKVTEKPLSYRNRLIEKIGIEEVRNRERASRLATKERKALAQSIPVS